MLKPPGMQEFALVLVVRCLMLLGYTTVVNFMFFYLQSVVHYAQVFPGQSRAQGVNLFFGVNVLSIILSSLVSGFVSDRLMVASSSSLASAWS